MIWRGHGLWFFFLTYAGTMSLWQMFNAIICIGMVGGILGGLITNQCANKLDPAKIHHFMYIPISYFGYLYIIFSIFTFSNSTMLNNCNAELLSQTTFFIFLFVCFGCFGWFFYWKHSNLDDRRKDELKSYIKIISQNLDKAVLIEKPMNSTTIDTKSFFDLNNMKEKLKKFYIGDAEVKKIQICFASEVVRFCLKKYKIDYQTIKINFFRMNIKEAGSITNRNGIWYIKLEERFMKNDVALTSIISHEIAHYVLLRKNVLLHPTIRNEELTDTTSIIAGFGKAQLASKHITQEVGDKVTLEKLGYLSVQDIYFIEKIKLAISSQKPIRRFYPINISTNSKIKCLGCMTNLGLPFNTGKLVIKCPLCQLRQKIKTVNNKGNTEKLLHRFYKYIDANSGW